MQQKMYAADSYLHSDKGECAVRYPAIVFFLSAVTAKTINYSVTAHYPGQCFGF